ncbi:MULTISPECIES: restriction endonuclease subunit S [unclassified Myroides]|uniref:restriction endonuclease subunit S n=1 Tax=unclassified Myroides TaxID=2642485 RepID=UPI003D2F55FE
MENRNWNSDKLGSVIEIKYGKDHKKLSEGNFPCLGSGGIMRYVDSYLYDDESILIPRKGSLNNIMFQDSPFWTVDTMFWSKIDKSKVFPKYLFYQLTLIDYENLNVGSAVPSLTVPVINEIEIQLPPLPEQKAIASVLSSLDDKIDLLHQQNQTLEALAETLYLNFIGEREFNSKLSNIFSLQNGYAFKSKSFKESGTIRVIKIKNISGDIVDITNSDFVDDESIKKLDTKFKINSGDIIIAMTGAEVGKLGIVPETDQSLWLNQRVGLLKEKFEGAKYLAYLHLKSDFGQDYIENTATGSAQPNISGEGIENCEFPFYEETELREICNKLSPLYDKVIFNLGQIQTLTKLRDTLLPKLMSGEVRVQL